MGHLQFRSMHLIQRRYYKYIHIMWDMAALTRVTYLINRWALVARVASTNVQKMEVKPKVGPNIKNHFGWYYGPMKSLCVTTSRSNMKTDTHNMKTKRLGNFKQMRCLGHCVTAKFHPQLTLGYGSIAADADHQSVECQCPIRTDAFHMDAFVYNMVTMKYQKTNTKKLQLQTIFIPCSDRVINSFNAKFYRKEKFQWTYREFLWYMCKTNLVK